jgi:hypothetical protein
MPMRENYAFAENVMMKSQGKKMTNESTGLLD